MDGTSHSLDCKDAMNAANFLGPNHELAIEYSDTSCTAQYGANEFVKMLESPGRAKVFGIVGCACSGPSMCTILEP